MWRFWKGDGGWAPTVTGGQLYRDLSTAQVIADQLQRELAQSAVTVMWVRSSGAQVTYATREHRSSQSTTASWRRGVAPVAPAASPPGDSGAQGRV